MPTIAFSSMYILIELLVCLVSILMTYQTQLASSITDKDLHHNNIPVRFDNSTSVSKNRSLLSRCTTVQQSHREKSIAE